MESEKFTNDYMNIEEIIEVIIKSNSNYRDLLEKSIQFEVVLKNDHPPYHAFTLLSIINNLVSNAVEAIENNGTITLTVNREGKTLIITVSDNGPGISIKNRSSIFQPGFTTKFDSMGRASSGIGLTFVKDFIENLGGTIRLENDGEAVETIFILTLPIDTLIKVSECI